MAQRKKKTKNTNKYYDLENNLDTSLSIKKIIGTIVGVLIFFAMVYGFTVLVLNKGEKRPEIGEATISYEKILAGSSLKQKSSEYSVLFFSTTDDELYSAMAEYRGRGKGTIYFVDLNDGLNKYVVADEVKLNVKSAQDLRVKNPTIIKVKNGKIVDNRIGKKKILDYLK